MADESQRPIIIIKRIKAKHEHHGGAWKVAMADFMTAMFALFLVLWILAQSQEVKNAVESYFRHPTDFEGKPDAFLQGNHGIQEHKQGRLDNRPTIIEVDQGGRSPGQGDTSGQTPTSVSGGKGAISPEEGLRPSVINKIEDVDDIRSFLKVADDLWAVLGSMPSFKKIKDNILIQALEEGLLIQLIEQEGAPLFDEGKDEFKPPIKQALGLIGNELSKYPNRIEIDGHGTNLGGLYEPHKKWIASTHMADVAREQLEGGGFKAGQVSKVSGCADARPLNPYNSKDPANRRISILVRAKQWQQERY